MMNIASFFQNASQNVKVAAVVSFYMSAALVVSSIAQPYETLQLTPAIVDGLRVRFHYFRDEPLLTNP